MPLLKAQLCRCNSCRMPQSLSDRFDTFFGQTGTRAVSLFRIVFSLQLLKLALYYLPLGTLFLSDAGIAPRQAILDATFVNSPSILFLFGAPVFVQSVLLLWIGVICCLLVGYRTRTMAVLNVILLMSVQGRNIFLLDSGDVLTRLLSFWLIFTPAAAHYSVDSFRKRVRRYDATRHLSDLQPPTDSIQMYTFPIRLLQLQFLLVYIVTALHKLTGPVWLRGEGVWYALQHETLLQPTGRFVFEVSPLWLLQGMSWYTVIVELILPCLLVTQVFQSRLRAFGIVLGVLLHVGIGTLMAIPNFSVVMCIGYLLFFEDRWITWIEDRLCANNAPFRVRWQHLQPGTPFLTLAALISTKRLILDAQANPTLADGLARLPLSRMWLPLLKDLGQLQNRLKQISRPWPVPIVDERPSLDAQIPDLGMPVGILLRRAALSVPLALFMGLVLWWNASNIEFKQWVNIPTMPNEVRTFSIQYGVSQSWRMFSPTPAQSAHWIRATGNTQDARLLDLRTGQTIDTIASASARTYRFGPFMRWQKYEDRLKDNTREPLLVSWADYYCRQFAEEGLENTTFVHLRRPAMHTNGEQEPIATEVLYVQRCP